MAKYSKVPRQLLHCLVSRMLYCSTNNYKTRIYKNRVTGQMWKVSTLSEMTY